MVYGGKNGERAGLSTFLEKQLILPTSSPVHIHNDKKVSHGNTIIDHIGLKIWDKLDPKYLDIVFLNGHQERVERKWRVNGIKGLRETVGLMSVAHPWLVQSSGALSRSQTKWGKKVLQGQHPCTSTFFLFVVDVVIHWNETAMGLHVFPIPIPPPTSLSTRSL